MSNFFKQCKNQTIVQYTFDPQRLIRVSKKRILLLSVSPKNFTLTECNQIRNCFSESLCAAIGAAIINKDIKYITEKKAIPSTILLNVGIAREVKID